MLSTTTLSQSEGTKDSNYYDFPQCQQQESSSQGSSSLPNMQSFLAQPLTNISLQVCLLFILYIKV